jgi:serine/threonine protein kinase
MQDTHTFEPALSAEFPHELRERCERGWSAGIPPDLVEAVRSAPESVRPDALRHVLRVERQHRAGSGRPLGAAEALDRARPLGPWAEEIVREVFAATDNWSDAAPPAPNRPEPDVPPADDRRPSRKYLGQYELLTKLGSGANGTVFKARHAQLKRLVALKVLIPYRVFTRTGFDRFRREMTVLGRLSHPHVVRATDAGEARGYPYLALEYVAGIDLACVLKRVARLGVADACELVRQAAEALAYIDRSGLVHRDVKPSNLLLGGDGVVRVLDLGLAHLSEAPPGETLTETGAVMGTPEYMAPEQTRASRDVDIRADVYGLGCTLFALLTGAPPFVRGASVYDLLRAHNETPPPSVVALRDGVPPDLDRLLFRMLEKQPADRPSPDDVARALQPWCRESDLGRLVERCGPAVELPVDLPETSDRLDFPGGETADPPPAEGPTVPDPGPPLPSARRRRRRALAAAALVLALGVAVWLARRAPDPGAEPTPVAAEPPLPPRTFKPGEWTDLLDRPPATKRIWRAQDGRCQSHYDPVNHLISVHCVDFGAIEFDYIDADEYDVAVTISHHTWSVGRLGVYFRGRPAPDADPQFSWQAETLILGSLDASVPQPTVAHGWVGVFAATGGYPSGTRRSYTVPRPVSDPHTLSCTVFPAGIKNVRWDGDLAEPVDPEVVPDRPPGGRGGLGLFVHDSNAVFLSARVRVH